MGKYKKTDEMFDRFLVDFGLILGGFWAPKSVQDRPGHARTAKIAQERPKIRLGGQLGAIWAPSWPNLAPFGLHVGPTWSPRRLQDGLKRVQVGPRIAPELSG